MSDPDRMRFLSGGGCLMLFGLPFFASGVFMMVAPFTGLDMHDEAGNAVGPLAVLPFGLLFGLIGAVIMFGRKGTDIDRRHEEVVSWWGLLVPLKKTRHALKGFEHVAMTREVRTSKNSSKTVYPVRLVGPSDLNLKEFATSDASRREAERVAKFLNMGVMDKTIDPPVFREAGTLDTSVREQLRDAPPPPPVFTQTARALYTREGRTSCSVDLPPLGWNPIFVVIAVGALVVPLGFALFTLSQGFSAQLSGEAPWQTIHYAFIGGGVLLALAAGIGPAIAMHRNANLRGTLSLNPDRVTLTQTWKFLSSEQSIPMDELEEVVVGRAGHAAPGPSRAQQAAAVHPLALNNTYLTLRSDRLTLACARGLEEADKEWLGDLVRYVAATGECPEA